MKHAIPTLAILLLAAPLARAEKNILDVWNGTMPAAPEQLLTSHPEIWNFSGFRPYGASTAQLWTDPAMERNVLAGGVADGKSPTALAFTCDPDGFNMLILCVEASMANAVANTNSLPGGRCEIYVAPDDTDNRDMIPYYQFELGADPDGKFSHYSWIVEDRRVRVPTPYMKLESRLLPNGWLHVIRFSWEAFWDKLPMKDRKDNFWRASVIRWADGGVSWGGVVHEASRFGYIRFPRFSAEERTEIHHRLLLRGWQRFRDLSSKPMYNPSRNWNAPWPLEQQYVLDERAGRPAAFIHYTQDPVFSKTLKAMVDERNGLAEGIARFTSMTPEEQEAFYDKAADMLFNFRYDVEKAYAAYVDDKLFAE